MDYASGESLLSLRLTMTAAGKIIDNRAVGAVISRTGFRQRQQLLAHRFQLRNVAFNLRIQNATAQT